MLGRVIDRLKITPAELGLKPHADGSDFLPQEVVDALEKLCLLQAGARHAPHHRLRRQPRTRSERRKSPPRWSANTSRADLAERNGVSGEANRFLLVQSEELQKLVATAEQAAQAYKDAHPGVPLDDSQNYVEGKLRDLTNRVIDARQLTIRLEADNQQAQHILSRYTGAEQTTKLLALQSVVSDPAVQDAQKNLAVQEAAVAALKQRYLPKHPRYIQEMSRLDENRAGAGTRHRQDGQRLGHRRGRGARERDAGGADCLNWPRRDKLETDRVAIPYAR